MVTSCSYEVAPKSSDDILSFGALFAFWGATTLISTAHLHLIKAPNRRKMMQTAANILSTNKTRLEIWDAEPS